MAKRVQLVLNKDVSKLGRSGDLVEVAPAMLVIFNSQKLAVNATPGILKQVERRREQERQRQLEQKQQAQTLKTTLEMLDASRLLSRWVKEMPFWNRHRSRSCSSDSGSDRSGSRSTGITLPDIGKTGSYKADIRLHPEVTAVVEIQVVAE